MLGGQNVNIDVTAIKCVMNIFSKVHGTSNSTTVMTNYLTNWLFHLLPEIDADCVTCTVKNTVI